jgi:hypothetical protein
MAFKLDIPPRVKAQISHSIEYILYEFKSPQTAGKLSDDIEDAYTILSERADTFGECDDSYLAVQGYHEIKLEHYRYLFIFRIDGEIVHIVGFFHMLEDYAKKV